MTKISYFGSIWAVFGPKILIFVGVSKSFGANITENHLDNLSALFFGQALDQMGQKCRYLAQNASLGQIWPFLGPKPISWGGGSKTFGTLISGNQWGTFSCRTHWPVRLQLAARNENVQFWRKHLHILAKSPLLVLESGFVKWAYHK